MSEGERLQKVLSRLGVASRRAAEELIAAGRVAVNGQVVVTPGTKVDPQRDRIAVDGLELPRPGEIERVTYMLNKPVGVVSTASDPQGRPTVVGLVPPTPRVYPVGRLDFDSDGLILLTNDGDLAQRLMHPSHEVEKEYEAWVRGHPSQQDLRSLRGGILLEGETRPTAPARVQEVERRGGETLLRFTIREGRNRQVRRMAEAVGLAVLRLKRTRLGPLMLGNLQPGKWRQLTPEELRGLAAALEGQEKPSGGHGSPAGTASGSKASSGSKQEHYGSRVTTGRPPTGRRRDAGDAPADHRRGTGRPGGAADGGSARRGPPPAKRG